MDSHLRANTFRRIWEEEKYQVREQLGPEWMELESSLYVLIDQMYGASESELDELIKEFMRRGKRSSVAPIFQRVNRRYRQKTALLEESADRSRVFSRTAGEQASTSSRTRGRQSTDAPKHVGRRGGATRGASTPPIESRRSSRRGAHAAGEQSMGTDEEGEARRQILRRTPHMDILADDVIQPSTNFSVSIYADQLEARPGETVQEIELNTERADVGVSLVVSGHFEVLSQSKASLIIDGDEPSTEKVDFTVGVRSVTEIDSLADVLASQTRGGISAIFTFNGRPVGRVSRVIELGKTATTNSTDGADERESERVHIQSDATPADITIEVVSDVINDGRQFHCRVTTISQTSVSEEWVPWNLPDVTSRIVNAYMEGFVDGRDNLLQTLVGAGRQLFDAAPSNFKELYWEMVGNGSTKGSIAIVSDESNIPWELMVPHRRKEGRNEEFDPLGVSFTIARWVTGDSVSPVQVIPLETSVIVAPDYGPGGRALPYANSEAKFVEQNFDGAILMPATRDKVDKELLVKKASILHFCCHGKSGSLDNQIVELEDETLLESAFLGGNDGFKEFFNDSVSLVFLNACEIGRHQPSLVGVGGFAKAFIDLGAAAVVAALWSVKDDIAHQIAMEFYKEILKDRDRSFADIFRSIRAKAYDRSREAEDTYAAYCFYGDPLARAG